MDSVSDRDFVIEFLSLLAIIGTHLSRPSEEIILWSSSPFNFVQLPDKYSTGSSMLPQKRNPDAAELIRGKSGRVIGCLSTLLVVDERPFPSHTAKTCRKIKNQYLIHLIPLNYVLFV